MSNPQTQVMRRRQTAANWTSANPTLALGELGWESDTNKLKVGDGTTVWSSLAYWKSPVPTVTLFEFAIPIGIPSNGTIGNNGALSGITALPKIYANIYLYFPANAISAGSAAGFYYCQMSSTTAGTIFNNTLAASGAPSIPASPTPFSTTGPGGYTQVTTAQTACTLALPVLAATSQLVIYNLFAISNTAQVKTYTGAIDGQSIFSIGPSANDSLADWRIWANQGVTGTQVTTSLASSSSGGAGVAPTYTTVDTSISKNFTVTLRVNATPASNWIVMEACRIIQA